MTKLVKLGPVLDQLIQECIDNGMSPRNAKRHVAKIAERMWKAGKIEIHGRKNSESPLEIIQPQPDMILVQEPREH